MFDFKCKSCGATLFEKVPGTMAEYKCAHCGTTVIVPSDTASNGSPDPEPQPDPEPVPAPAPEPPVRRTGRINRYRQVPPVEIKTYWWNSEGCGIAALIFFFICAFVLIGYLESQKAYMYGVITTNGKYSVPNLNCGDVDQLVEFGFYEEVPVLQVRPGTENDRWIIPQDVADRIQKKEDRTYLLYRCDNPESKEEYASWYDFPVDGMQVVYKK